MCRLQDEYSKQYATFKPDKKLRWLPHLGSIQLELTLQDRTVSADVPPLEAAFIELFSEKGTCLSPRCSVPSLTMRVDTWPIDELRAKVGNVDRISAGKALATWVELGVLRAEGDGTYRLLEVAEEIASSGSAQSTRREYPCAVVILPSQITCLPSDVPLAEEEAPAIMTVQQQQAEQMKVYWKVSHPAHYMIRPWLMAL